MALPNHQQQIHLELNQEDTLKFLVKQFHLHYKNLLSLNYKLLRSKKDQRIQQYEFIQDQIHQETAKLQDSLTKIDNQLKKLDQSHDAVKYNIVGICDIIRQQQRLALENVQQNVHEQMNFFMQSQMNRDFMGGGAGNQNLDPFNFGQIGGNERHRSSFDDGFDFVPNFNQAPPRGGQQVLSHKPSMALDDDPLGIISTTHQNQNLGQVADSTSKTDLVLNQIDTHFKQVHNNQHSVVDANINNEPNQSATAKSVSGASKQRSLNQQQQQPPQSNFFANALGGMDPGNQMANFDFNQDLNDDLADNSRRYSYGNYNDILPDSPKMTDNQDELINPPMDEIQNQTLGMKGMCREKFKEQLYDMIVDIKLQMEAKLQKQNQVLDECERFINQKYQF
eukprot:403337883